MITRKIGGRSRAAPAETAWTWNSADKGANVTLSESDKLATFAPASGYQTVRGPAITGLRYFIIEVAESGSGGTLLLPGVANGSQSLSSQMGINTNSVCLYTNDIYYNSGIVVENIGVSIADGVQFMFAVNANNGRIWIGNRATGTWFNSGDPAAGTGYVATLTGTLYPAVSGSTDAPSPAARAISYPIPPATFYRL